MEKIIVDEDTKEKIYEHIQGSIGYYGEYADEIKTFNTDGILNREFATRILENLVYSCKQSKLQLQPNEEFKNDILNSTKLFDSVPKSSNYDEYEYTRDTNVAEYENMEIGEIYSNIKKCIEVERVYNKVHFIQNLRERAYSTIKSIRSISEHEIYVSLEEREILKQLCEKLKRDTSQEKTEVNDIQMSIQEYNRIASQIWKNYLTNDTEEPRWLVHNLSKGAFDGNFNKKYMSTSLVTKKTMGLYSENIGNNFGFIIKPKNIISASEHDTFTNNSPIINQYMQTFSGGNIPPIKLPWEIEDECIKRTIDYNGEMLNYDNRNVYSEIVVDEFEIEAIYYRSNGEGELAPNYEAAKKMAEERKIELKELDISKYREAQGLEAMTENMQKKFLCNVLRKYFMSEEQIKQTMGYRRKENDIEGQFVDRHYKEFYQRYLKLRNSGEYTKDAILQEFFTMSSDKELEAMKEFYIQEKEKKHQSELYSHAESNIRNPRIELVSQQEEAQKWTDRFKGWYEAIDRVPESIRAKFIKMRSDIINSIKNRLKERNRTTQENMQNTDEPER